MTLKIFSETLLQRTPLAHIPVQVPKKRTPLEQTFKVAITSPKDYDIKYTSKRKLYLPCQDQPNFIVLNTGSIRKLQ